MSTFACKQVRQDKATYIPEFRSAGAREAGRSALDTRGQEAHPTLWQERACTGGVADLQEKQYNDFNVHREAARDAQTALDTYPEEELQPLLILLVK